MKTQHRFLLAALAALGSLPALAGSITLPGAMCVSDQAVDRPVTGSLLNQATAAGGTAKFSCPIIRTEPVTPSSSTLSFTINAKVNNSSAPFVCIVRSIYANGSMHDSTEVGIPSKGTVPSGFFTAPSNVSMPANYVTSLTLRCNVPNVTSGESAGIMSYKTDD